MNIKLSEIYKKKFMKEKDRFFLTFTKLYEQSSKIIFLATK